MGLLSKLAAPLRSAVTIVVILQAVTIVGLIFQTVYLQQALASVRQYEPEFEQSAGLSDLTRSIDAAVSASEHAATEAQRAASEANEAELAANMAAEGVNDILRLGVTCD